MTRKGHRLFGTWHTFNPTSRHPMIHPFARYLADELAGNAADTGGMEAGDPSPQGSSSAPQGEPSGQAPSPSTYNPQTHILADKGAFRDFPGGYKEAVSLARQARQLREDGWFDFAQKAGVSGKQMMEWWEVPAGTPETPENPEASTPSALTPETIQKMLSEALDQRDQRMQQQQMQQQARQQETQAREAERNFAGDLLKKAGLLEEGKPVGPLARMATNSFYDCVAAALQERVPDFWPQDRKNAFLAAPADAQSLARAAELWQAHWADVQNQMVSAFAKRQQQTPGATLGSGPAGRQPPKSMANMSRQEQIDYVTGHLQE